MRAPHIIAKKCSVVKVKGFGAAKEDEEEQQAGMNTKEPMDMSEVKVCGIQGDHGLKESQIRLTKVSSDHLFRPVRNLWSQCV